MISTISEGGQRSISRLAASRSWLMEPRYHRPGMAYLAPGLNAREGFVPVHDEVELRLARIWEELLDVQPIDVHDNFFALGGDSLVATQVATRIRADFEVELSLRRLFQVPTLAQLAQAVRQALPEDAAPPPIVPVPRDVPGGELPLSFAQQRLWFL